MSVATLNERDTLGAVDRADETTPEEVAAVGFESLDELADEALAEYRGLVLLVAEGAKPDRQTIINTVTVVGKSLETFKSDVERLRHRKALTEELFAIEQSEREKADVDRDLAAANAELQAQRAAFEKQVAPIVDRIAQLKRLSDSLRSASSGKTTIYQQLSASADPAIEREYQQLGRQAAQLEKRRQFLQSRGIHINVEQELRIAQQDVAELEKEPEPATGTPEAWDRMNRGNVLRERLQRLRNIEPSHEPTVRNVEATNAALAALAQERAALNSQMQAVARRMWEWKNAEIS